MNDSSRLADLATRYTAAWRATAPRASLRFTRSQPHWRSTMVRLLSAEKGSRVRPQSFMTGYPDLVVKFDRLEPKGDRVLYHWTLTGTNTGSGGTGNQVRISGYEDWKIGSDGLIADSAVMRHSSVSLERQAVQHQTRVLVRAHCEAGTQNLLIYFRAPLPTTPSQGLGTGETRETGPSLSTNLLTPPLLPASRRAPNTGPAVLPACGTNLRRTCRLLCVSSCGRS